MKALDLYAVCLANGVLVHRDFGSSITFELTEDDVAFSAQSSGGTCMIRWLGGENAKEFIELMVLISAAKISEDYVLYKPEGFHGVCDECFGAIAARLEANGYEALEWDSYKAWKNMPPSFTSVPSIGF